MLCYLTLFGWVALELVSDLAGLSTKILFSLHCTASRRFHLICFPLYKDSSTFGLLTCQHLLIQRPQPWDQPGPGAEPSQSELEGKNWNLDQPGFSDFKRSHLEPPKPSDGKLCVEISNDWKVAYVTQVDEVVLTEEFAKGGKGLCSLRKLFLKVKNIACMNWREFAKGA